MTVFASEVTSRVARASPAVAVTVFVPAESATAPGEAVAFGAETATDCAAATRVMAGTAVAAGAVSVAFADNAARAICGTTVAVGALRVIVFADGARTTAPGTIVAVGAVGLPRAVVAARTTEAMTFAVDAETETDWTPAASVAAPVPPWKSRTRLIS